MWKSVDSSPASLGGLLVGALLRLVSSGGAAAGKEKWNFAHITMTIASAMGSAGMSTCTLLPPRMFPLHSATCLRSSGASYLLLAAEAAVIYNLRQVSAAFTDSSHCLWAFYTVSDVRACGAVAVTHSTRSVEVLIPAAHSRAILRAAMDLCRFTGDAMQNSNTAPSADVAPSIMPSKHWVVNILGRLLW